MKKQLTLATAIALASQSQAAFDPDSFVLIAYDPADDDTYFVDLGTTTTNGISFDFVNDSASLFSTSSVGLAIFAALNPGVKWQIIGAVNDPELVGGAPAVGQSYANRGIISTSTSGIQVANTGDVNEGQRLVWLDWLADIKAQSGGATEFGVLGADPVSANSTRNNAFFSDSLVSLESSAALWYSQADPRDFALLSDQPVVSQLFPFATVGTNGSISAACLSIDCGGALTPPNPVPIPATAWLFASALIGLLGAKRKS